MPLATSTGTPADVKRRVLREVRKIKPQDREPVSSITSGRKPFIRRGRRRSLQRNSFDPRRVNESAEIGELSFARFDHPPGWRGLQRFGLVEPAICFRLVAQSCSRFGERRESPIDRIPRLFAVRSCRRLPPSLRNVPDVMAGVSPRALGRGGGGGFLYDGSLDVARVDDVLHPVRDRPGLTTHPDRGLHTPSRRPVHATGESYLTATDGVLSAHHVLICDRDGKWSKDVRQLLDDAGVHVVRTPFKAPNANTYAERFVRSIKHECLNRIVTLCEHHPLRHGSRTSRPR